MWPNPESHTPGDRYCLPEYDENGRVGPIADYHRLACETGGNYHYVTEVGRTPIAGPLISAMWSPEAAWAVAVDIDDHPPNTGDPYLLDTTMDVTIDRTQRLRMTLGGDTIEDDRRQVFFSGD